MNSILRSFAALVVFPAAAHADAAHELPVCGPFPEPAADSLQFQERGFAFRLPAGAKPDPRGPSLDHEFGRWTWTDERQVYFQYGFAVTELADWLSETLVSGCRASLDGVDAVFLERRQPNGLHVWAIGLFDFVQTYRVSGADGPLNPVNQDDFVLIGSGRSESVYAEGRAVFGSFKWSRLPEAALAAWSVKGASNNGVIVFETEKGATALMLATYRDGKPHWLVATPPGPVMSHVAAAAEFDGSDARVAAVPLTLYETSDGVAPGDPDHPARLALIGEAEFAVSLGHDCRRARLRWQPDGPGATGQTLMLSASYPPLHGCSPYRP